MARRMLVALLFVSCLLAAGCGSSGDDQDAAEDLGGALAAKDEDLSKEFCEALLAGEPSTQDAGEWAAHYRSLLEADAPESAEPVLQALADRYGELAERGEDAGTVTANGELTEERTELLGYGFSCAEVLREG